MEVERVLRKIGFSPNEIKVYLALTDHGSSKAGKISKIAKIDRSSCYNSLKLLTEKGLVSYVTIGKVKWFQATGPKRLLEYVQEQEEDIKSIMPELQERHKYAKLEGQVRMYKGIKGVRTVFQDMLRTGKDNFVFGSEGQFVERMPHFSKYFGLIKKEKGFKTKMIIRAGRAEGDSERTEYRFVDKDVESPVVTNIYGDKIAIIIWTDEPEAIIIENKAAAESYRNYFDFMWKNARK